MSTNVTGTVKVIDGKEGTTQIQSLNVAKDIKLGENTTLTTFAGKQNIESNLGSFSSTTTGVKGVHNSDVGKTGFALSNTQGKGPQGPESHTSTMLNHSFKPSQNSVVTPSMGFDTHTVGGVTSSGPSLGVDAALKSGLGVTSAALSQSALSGPGISELHRSATLRHDVPVGASSSLGASVLAESHKMGPSFQSSGTGFGLHGATATSLGNTSVDFLHKNMSTPMGPVVSQVTTLNHQVPLGNDAFVGPFVSHGSQTFGGNTSNSSSFGFNFGLKF